MMDDRLLPLGSVVVLFGGTKKIMINGYYVEVPSKKGKTFDYRGCPFPEGVFESDGVALFDHSQIKDVVHTGYNNDEMIDFLDKMEIIKDKVK